MTPSSKSVSDGVCECERNQKHSCGAKDWEGCLSTCQPQQEKCQDFKNGSCIHYCGDADPCPVLGPKGYPLPEDLKNTVRIEINPPQQEPMNQDNQVSWQILLVKLFRLHGYAALAGADTKIGQHIETAISLIERHIAQVSKDRYAEGIRRAREVLEKDWNGSITDLMYAFKKLEEEVKK